MHSGNRSQNLLPSPLGVVFLDTLGGLVALLRRVTTVEAVPLRPMPCDQMALSSGRLMQGERQMLSSPAGSPASPGLCTAASLCGPVSFSLTLKTTGRGLEKKHSDRALLEPQDQGFGLLLASPLPREALASRLLESGEMTQAPGILHLT